MLLPEEMQRTVRFFQYHKAEWRNKAEAEDSRGNPGNAAHARRYVHRVVRTFKAITDKQHRQVYGDD